MDCLKHFPWFGNDGRIFLYISNSLKTSVIPIDPRTNYQMKSNLNHEVNQTTDDRGSQIFSKLS